MYTKIIEPLYDRVVVERDKIVFGKYSANTIKVKDIDDILAIIKLVEST